MNPTDTPSRLGRRERRTVLAVTVFALAMVVTAVAGLNVALPELARDTGASQRELQWIVDAYALVFAGLLLPAGAIGDRYGRRGALLAGLAIFGAAAGAATFVDDPVLLIALRAAMGVGAALVMPVTLSIITTEFPPEERGRAVGLWVGVAGGSAAVGLLVSGLLLEWLAWNAFFALNVALALVAVAGTIAFVPRSRDPERRRLDPVGALLAVAGLVGVVFAIIEGPDRGWTEPLTLGAFAGGLLALAAFVAWELRQSQPMLDPRLFRLRGFGTGSLSLTVQFFAAFGFLFLALQYLQLVAGFSPLEAGAAMLPMPLALVPLARRAPALAERYGIRVVGAAGLTLIAGAFVILSFLESGSPYWHFAAGLVVLGAGMALAGAPATTAIVSSLPAAKQGVASAVNDTTRELGGALGIAVLGSLFNAGYRSGIAEHTAGLPPDVAAGAEDSVAFALGAERLGPAGERLAAAATDAFVNGFGTALLVGAAVLLAGAAYVALRAPRRADVPDAVAAEAAGSAP